MGYAALGMKCKRQKYKWKFSTLREEERDAGMEGGEWRWMERDTESLLKVRLNSLRVVMEAG